MSSKHADYQGFICCLAVIYPIYILYEIPMIQMLLQIHLKSCFTRFLKFYFLSHPGMCFLNDQPLRILPQPHCNRGEWNFACSVHSKEKLYLKKYLFPETVQTDRGKKRFPEKASLLLWIIHRPPCQHIQRDYFFLNRVAKKTVLSKVCGLSRETWTCFWKDIFLLNILAMLLV